MLLDDFNGGLRIDPLSTAHAKAAREASEYTEGARLVKPSSRKTKAWLIAALSMAGKRFDDPAKRPDFRLAKTRPGQHDT